MATGTTDSLLELLKQSNLLTGQQFAQIRKAAAQAKLLDKPQALADGLVKKGLLTGWQAEQLLAGRQAFFLGKYKLVDRLGSGGMGAVFKAEEVTLRRLVAIKVVQQERLEKTNAAARFRREIQAASALRHPNIIAALDADQIGSVHFLVMEYVEGQDLNRWLKQAGPLPISWACECIRQSAIGLQYAFEQGLVHRDIKPANLLVHLDRENGWPTVKILDLGLARFIREREAEGELTESGQILGTPDYIAPEQAKNTRTADIRADIFSLGCTLYRILTGRLPFDGASAIEKLVARYTSDAPPLRQSRPEIPPPLEGIVAKMLAREPADRYQTPAEVAAVLAPFSLRKPQRGAPALAPPVANSAPPRSAPPVGGATPPPLPALPAPLSPQQMQLAEGPTLAAPATPATGSNGAGGKHSGDANDGASLDTHEFLTLLAGPNVRTSQATQRTPALEGDTREERTRGRKRDRTRAAAVVARRRKGRDFPWGPVGIAAAVVVLVGLAIGWYFQPPGTRVVLDWPAADRRAARVLLDGQPQECDLAAPLVTLPTKPGSHKLVIERDGFPPFSRVVKLYDGEQHPVKVTFAPSFDQERRLRWDSLAKSLDVLLIAPEQERNSPAVDRARELIKQFRAKYPNTPEASLATQMLVRLPRVQATLDSLDPLKLPAEFRSLAKTGLVGVLGDPRLRHQAPVTALQYDPRGETIASASVDGVVRLSRASDGTLLHQLAASPNTYALSFSSDSKLLASLGYNTDRLQIRIWDVTTGNLIRELDTGRDQPLCMAFVPGQGSLLATGAHDGALQFYDARTGQARKRISAHEGFLLVIAFSPNGQRMATAGGDGVKLWTLDPEPTTSRNLEAFTASSANRLPGAKSWALTFSPDGRLLASVCQDQATRIWDVAKAELITDIPNSANFTQALAFGPQGKRLVLGGRGTETVRIWNFEKQLVEQRFYLGATYCRAVTFSPKEGAALALADGSQVKILDPNSGGEKFRTLGHQAGVLSLAFNADGRTLTSYGLDQRTLRWNPLTGQLDSSSQPGGGALWGTLDEFGEHLLALTSRRQATWFDLAAPGNGKPIPPTEAEHETPRVALRPDGQQVAWVLGLGNNRADTIAIWDAVGGRPRLNIRAEGATTISDLLFSPDSQLLAALAFRGDAQATVYVWSVQDGTLLARREVSKNGVRLLAFSADHTRLAVFDSQRVQVWQTTDLEPVWQSGDVPNAVAGAFHPTDPNRCVTIHLNGRLVSWNLQAESAVQRLDFGNAAFSWGQRVTYHPDGRHVAVGTNTGPIYLVRLQEK